MCNLTLYNLRGIKEWIPIERPITICAIVKTWLSQGSQIQPQCDITRSQPSIVHITEKTAQHHVQNIIFGPQPGCLDSPAGFISTCLYSSKVKLTGVFSLTVSPLYCRPPWWRSCWWCHRRGPVYGASLPTWCAATASRRSWPSSEASPGALRPPPELSKQIR